MKKFLFVLILTFVSAFCLCSCVYEETIISDTALYDSIWELSERRIVEPSELFPSSINDKDCNKFNCIHTSYLPVGTGWQIELSINYDSVSFVNETNRLNKVCENSVVYGESIYFESNAYAAVWNWNGCFEYAVCDTDTLTITYIYLQLINKEDLKISFNCVPINYNLTMEDSAEFSIYELK